MRIAPNEIFSDGVKNGDSPKDMYQFWGVVFDELGWEG